MYLVPDILLALLSLSPGEVHVLRTTSSIASTPSTVPGWRLPPTADLGLASRPPDSRAKQRAPALVVQQRLPGPGLGVDTLPAEARVSDGDSPRVYTVALLDK